MFILGVIAGILIAILIFEVLLFFRLSIERAVKKVEQKTKEISTDYKGFIVEPEDEHDQFRREYIEKNDKDGKDTKLSDLT